MELTFLHCSMVINSGTVWLVVYLAVGGCTGYLTVYADTTDITISLLCFWHLCKNVHKFLFLCTGQIRRLFPLVNRNYICFYGAAAKCKAWCVDWGGHSMFFRGAVKIGLCYAVMLVFVSEGCVWTTVDSISSTWFQVCLWCTLHCAAVCHGL